MIAGMQLWRDVSQTSYNDTVSPRYSLNKKYMLLLVLSTDRLSMREWISTSTLTAQSHMWMSPLLLLVPCNPSLVSATSTKPGLMANRAEKNKFDRYPHTNLVPFILETTGRPGPHARKIHQLPHARRGQPSACHQGHLVSFPKCAPQCHLQTTTHSRRYVISGDHCHT